MRSNSKQRAKPLQNSSLDQNKVTVDVLRQKITDLVTKQPDKAAHILSQWINGKRSTHSKKKR